MSRYIAGAMGLSAVLLVIGTYFFVRSWWGRFIWLAAVAGTFLLGYFGLAVQVVMLIVLAIKEVMVKMDTGALAASINFTHESDGRILATDSSNGHVMIYESVDEMPLHLHAQYLKQIRST